MQSKAPSSEALNGATTQEGSEAQWMGIPRRNKWLDLLRNSRAQNRIGRHRMTCLIRLTRNSSSRLTPPPTRSTREPKSSFVSLTMGFGKIGVAIQCGSIHPMASEPENCRIGSKRRWKPLGEALWSFCLSRRGPTQIGSTISASSMERSALFEVDLSSAVPIMVSRNLCVLSSSDQRRGSLEPVLQ